MTQRFLHMTNTSNLPAEASEIEYPLTLLHYEMVDGSGGPGQFYGGMGLRRVYRAEADCRVKVDGSRMRSQPWGLAGGMPGSSGSYAFSEDVSDIHNGMAPLKAGQTITVITPGAGGYGPLSARDPVSSQRDVPEKRMRAN